MTFQSTKTLIKARCESLQTAMSEAERLQRRESIFSLVFPGFARRRCGWRYVKEHWLSRALIIPFFVGAEKFASIPFQLIAP
jgi:hypothetical protein